MEQQKHAVRTVMRPLRSKNITLTQARRAWLTVMRREREAAKRAAGQREARAEA
jgi:hypothetical protein